MFALLLCVLHTPSNVLLVLSMKENTVLFPIGIIAVALL